MRISNFIQFSLISYYNYNIVNIIIGSNHYDLQNELTDQNQLVLLEKFQFLKTKPKTFYGWN
jgi:hypothetical protein